MVILQPHPKYIQSATHAAMPTIGPLVAIGPSIEALVSRGQISQFIELEKGQVLRRPIPFYAEPMVEGVSQLANQFDDHANRVGQAGPVRLVDLENVSVLGRDGISFYQGRVLENSLQRVESWRPETRVARLDEAGFLRLKAAAAVTEIRGPLVVGFVGAWPNYAHWITECLPRAMAFLELLRLEPAAKLLIPELPNGSPQGRSLEWLGIRAHQTMQLSDHKAIWARHIWHVTGLDVWRPPSLCRTTALRISGAIEASLSDQPASMATHVYIRRGMLNRRLTNFDELRPILDHYGFKVICAQDLSFESQVDLMRGARFVIGENSGGLANIMFCRDGVRLLELHNPAFPHPAHWALSGLLKGGYGFCVGDHQSDHEPDANSDYSIPKQNFAKAVASLTLN